MAQSGAIRAGKAFVEFFADKSPFVRGLRSMEKEMKDWGGRIAKIGGSIAGAGAAIKAAFAPMLVQFASSGDELAKMSQRTGLATESLAFLRYAADSNGASLNDVASAVGTVQDKLLEVARGSLDAAMGFARIGIDARRLARLKPEDQFVAIAEQLSRIPNLTVRAAMANEVFGGSAQALLPLINNGAKGLADLKKRYQEISGETGKNAALGEQLTGAFTNLKYATAGLTSEIANALAPSMIEFQEWAATIIGQVTTWVRDNQELIRTVAKIGSVLVAVGTVIAGVGGVVALLGTAFGIAASAVTAIGAVLGALLSPIGLTVTALVGLGAAFFTLTGIGQQALQWLIDRFRDLSDDATESWGVIVDAIKAGNLQAAFAVAMAFLRVEWVKATSWMFEKWGEFTDAFMTAWDVAIGFFKKLFIDAGPALQEAWVNFSAFVTNQWEQVTATFVKLWRRAVATVMNEIARITDSPVFKLMAKAVGEAEKKTNRNTDRRTAISIQENNLKRDAGIRAIRGGMSEENRQKFEAIDSDVAKRKAARDAARAQASTDGGAALTAAEEELRKAIEAARKAAATPTPVRGKRDIGQMIPNLMAGSIKASTVGTFSAAAAGRIGGTDPMLTEAQTQTGLLRTIATKQMTFG